MSGDDMIETDLITQVEQFLKESKSKAGNPDYAKLEAQRFYLRLLDIAASAKEKLREHGWLSFRTNGLNIYGGKDFVSILTEDIPIQGVGSGLVEVHQDEDPKRKSEAAELTKVETNTILRVNLLGERSTKEEVLKALKENPQLIIFLATKFLFDQSGKAVKVLSLPKGIKVEGGKVLKTRDPEYVPFQYVALPIEDHEIETIGMIIQEFGQRLEPNPISSAA